MFFVSFQKAGLQPKSRNGQGIRWFWFATFLLLHGRDQIGPGRRISQLEFSRGHMQPQNMPCHPHDQEPRLVHVGGAAPDSKHKCPDCKTGHQGSGAGCEGRWKGTQSAPQRKLAVRRRRPAKKVTHTSAKNVKQGAVKVEDKTK